MKHIALKIEENDEIIIYTDTRLSQDEVIEYLDNALFMLKDKPMKAIRYSKSEKDSDK